MILTIVHIFFGILFIYLAINTLYFLVIAIGGKLYRPAVYLPNPETKKIAVLIPSYKEDEVILHTARKAKTHDYLTGSFDVFIAADQLNPSTIALLKEIPVNVVEVKFEISS